MRRLSYRMVHTSSAGSHVSRPDVESPDSTAKRSFFDYNDRQPFFPPRSATINQSRKKRTIVTGTPRRHDRRGGATTGIKTTLSENLKRSFAGRPNVSLAWLFGSRAKGAAHPLSDWDFAIWLDPVPTVDDRLILKEDIRCGLAALLRVSPDTIDVVELNSAPLSMLSTIADDGVVLKGEDSLALHRFYTRVWALSEDFYWRLHNENRTLPG